MSTNILKFYGVAVVLGVLTGAIASFFQLAILKLDSLLAQLFTLTAPYHIPLWLISGIVTTLMILIAWLFVHYVAPEAQGSGVPEILP